MAYLTIEKPGEGRMDWRIAQLCTLVANCMGRGAHQPAFKISQFMPDLRSAEEREALMLAEREVEGIRQRAANGSAA